MPTFTPAIGHSYLPPSSKKSNSNISLPPTQSSKEASPMPGISTPLPATQETSISSKGQSSSPLKSDVDYQSLQMLIDSYNLSLRYANEYMDENPLVGEPGSFRLTKSHDSTLTSSMSTNKSSQPLSVPAPTPVPTPDKGASTPEERADDLSGPVRKPTKGPEKNPPSAGIKKEKKERRKSKAAGAGDTITPKATTPKTTTPS